MAKQEKKPEYIHLAYVGLEYGMQLIAQNINEPMKKDRVEISGHSIYLTSPRLRTFHYSGLTCKCCGRR